MKILESWLREWVSPDVNTEQLCHQLTMAGLEVDDYAAVAPAFSGVVVGEILSVTPHPDADKLRVCTVAVGQTEPLQIVCGAPNAAVGCKVPTALVGAKLPGDFSIKKGKLRGVESFGMLCGASEIGLTDTIDGLLCLPIDAPVGQDIRVYLQLDDTVIDVSITPNRGDCFSVQGLARELSVINHLTLAIPTTSPVEVAPLPKPKELSVKVLSLEACPHYSVRSIQGINSGVATPTYIMQRLQRCGIRPHSFVVDISNYVMLELGQPMHAFDADNLNGGLQIRMAAADETLTLLNEQTITLSSDCLVIADDTKVQALAGIMGGLASAVNANTVNIVLEAAHFTPLAIAGRARRFGLHTDASQRFERGVDYLLPLVALNRATALILKYAGGAAGAVVSVLAEVSPQQQATQQSFEVSLAFIQQRLGFEVPADFVSQTLASLAIPAVAGADSTWQITAPSHRFDIALPEDISEEIARIYGYDNIPIKMPQFAMQLPASSDATSAAQLKQRLVTMGYQEAISFSFVDQKIVDVLQQGPALALANPISSDLGVMRPSVLASLLPCLQYNLNRQQTRVRLFELGLSFSGGQADIAALQQTPTFCLLATGPVTVEQWDGKPEAIDFFQFKSEVERVVPALQSDNLQQLRSTNPWMHPGLSVDIIDNGQKVGCYGRMHPSVEKALGLVATWVCELPSRYVLAPLHYTINTLSKYPSVRRDIAVIVEATVDAKALLTAAQRAAGEYLTESWIFDVYAGTGIQEGKKSVAIALIWQHRERTLAEDEMKQCLAAVVTSLEHNFTAQLRSL